MKEADPLAYMRNINTSPGPNAGRSIDPTKPGPDADRIAELEREIAEQELAFRHGAFPNVARELRDKKIAALSRLRNEQQPGWDSIVHELGECPTISSPAPSPVREASRDDDEAAMVWNKIAPSEPQDVREAVASVLRRYGIAKSSAEHVAAQVLAALAQSDAQPNSRGALNHIARLTKQRDALIHVLQRCRMVLNNMAMENEGSRFNRWPIHHEPLRSDAKHLLPLIESTLDAVPEPEAQSDAQPVGWRYPWKHFGWAYTTDRAQADALRESGLGVEPIYVTPPSLPEGERGAGLIEAAEWHEVTARHAEEMAAASDNHPDFVKEAEIHRYSADVFRNWIERARAADRNPT